MAAAKRDGWVYVLTNQAIPGVVKIGRTERSPEARLRDHNALLGLAAGLPPFVLAFACSTPDCVKLERWLHLEFALVRTGEGGSREFFAVSANEVRLALFRSPLVWYAAREGADARQIPRSQWYERLCDNLPEQPSAEPIDFELMRVPKHNISHGRVVRGGPIYCWLHDRFPELGERQDTLGARFCAVISYEIGLSFMEKRGHFAPPHPEIVERLWASVCAMDARYGWEKGKYKHDDFRTGPETGEGSPDAGGEHGAALAPLPLDEAQLCGVVGGVHGEWPPMVGPGGSDAGGRFEGLAAPGSKRPHGATDVVSALQGHGEAGPLRRLHGWLRGVGFRLRRGSPVSSA